MPPDEQDASSIRSRDGEVAMIGTTFDVWSRRQFGAAAGGAAATLLGLGDVGEAKNQKPRGKKKKGLCRRNGQRCRKPGNSCKKTFCLNAPFAIEANWGIPAGHDAFLFVPPEDESTGPSPFIQYDCDKESHACEDEYPFACASGDETSSGSEVITIFALIEGTYEYWSELSGTTLAGELTIVLKDGDGRIVREWTNPANPAAIRKGWHVFDVNGSNGSITSINELIDDRVESGDHVPSTNVCRS